MRRREKFVIASVLLSLGLLVVQYVPLDWRYVAVGLFTLISFGISVWALSDDLQPHEWLTIVPLPSVYAGAIGLFYFLLPESWLSTLFVLGLFGLGMYALYLTCNIFSVAKGRTIQLLHAAHAIGLLFTLLTSLLVTNTVFSLRLPFYWNGVLVAAVHFVLTLMSLWSVNLEPRLTREIIFLTSLVTLVVAELGIVFSFLPLSVWNSALLITAVLYISLGVLHNLLKGRLFSRTLTEYSLVAGFVCLIFIFLFPGK